MQRACRRRLKFQCSKIIVPSEVLARQVQLVDSDDTGMFVITAGSITLAAWILMLVLLLNKFCNLATYNRTVLRK